MMQSTAHLFSDISGVVLTRCGGVARLTSWQTLRTGCGGSSLVGGCSPSPGSPCSGAAPSPSPCRNAAPVGHHWAWCNAQSVADPPPSWTTSPSRSTEDKQWDNHKLWAETRQEHRSTGFVWTHISVSVVMPSTSTSNIHLFANIDVFDNRVAAECQLTDRVNQSQKDQSECS